jgi:hypothetical protein
MENVTMNSAQVTLIVSVITSVIVSATPIVAGLLFFERRLAKVEAGIEYIKGNCQRSENCGD